MDNFKAYKDKLTKQIETDYIVHLTNAYNSQIHFIIVYVYQQYYQFIHTKKLY